MNIGRLFLSVALTTAPLCVLRAADSELEKDFRQEIALYRIRPDRPRSLRRDPDGTPVTEAKLKEAAGNFYGWLYPLDPAFLKRFQIKNVVFKDTVFDRDGDQYQMLPVSDSLFVDADLDEKQFYTNLFYRQLSVMPRSYLGHWNKLNPDGFSYENTRGSLSGHAQKKLDEALNEWDKCFVSRAGMYSTEMDMAQTFAYMVAKGPDATAFVKENDCPTVRKKFDMIADILESVKATERGYMATLLADDLAKLKTYSPYALSVRLEREYSGVWTSWKDAEAAEDGAEPKALRKIGDPVEVAGRRVIPLVLALETKNNRLFGVLMANKVNPNVANDKKMSALKLAIANNDPEQVKALLEAGANVTQEAARAGTASGVNSEIMKLMNAYLPGVRTVAATHRPPNPSTEKKSPDGALYRQLNETMIDHIDFEEVRLAAVVEFLQTMSKRNDPAGQGVDIVVDPETERKSHLFVSFAVDNVSLYDAIGSVCKIADVAFRIDEAGKRVIIRPKSTTTGSAKERQ
jgi:hypothetical protein